MVKGPRTFLQSLRAACPSARLSADVSISSIIFTIIATVTLLSLSVAIPAQLSRYGEYEIKAAFLFNFIKFTEWPNEDTASKTEPFVIGVLGTDPFGAALDKTIEGESLHQKPLIVRRFSRLDESVGNSRVLFISASEESNLAAILKLLDGRAILTVSEIDNFAQRGGIIKLRKENNKILFDINVDAARRARLAMHAQLLKLAKIVKTRS
jgi:hypothetical protein